MNWKKLRYRGEYNALRVAAKLIPLLPRAAVVSLAKSFGALAAVVDRAGRKVSLANLEAAFGEKYSRPERRRLVRQSYQHFAQTMLDLLWSPRLTRENFPRYVEFKNLPELAAGESLILACYHYSNFEWLGLAFGFAGFTGTVIAQEFKNSALDPVFRRWRQQSGHNFIRRTGGIGRLFKALRRGGNTALVVDLTVRPGNSAVAIKCFGLETSVTPAHAWLQQRSGAALFPAHCEPLPGGRYRIVVHPRIVPKENATLREIAQSCWDAFEPVVRTNPAPWLWSYKHWRYRPAKTDRVYPFYSGFHPKFETMQEKK